MIALGAASIPTYRTFGGKPRRGISAPHPSGHELIRRIRKQTSPLANLSAAELIDATDQLRNRIVDGESVTQADVVCQSFALTTEALRRATGMVYYDVQLLGGLALAAGCIAEIQTGEGKTITTGLPAVLHALTGKGVHVATTNEYLSERDHEELRPVFKQLGLTSGWLKAQGELPDKIKAYACDITYGPGYEFGFDFLKDQLAIRSRYQEPLGERFLRSMRGIVNDETPLAQRGHAFAIIDEADSVLIDEATTPLIMSGGKMGIKTADALFIYARDVALEMPEDCYEVDHAKRVVQLTDKGWTSAHKAFEKRPPGRLARQWSKLIEHALRAEHILQRDVDYVIKENAVLIVDQNTGRIHDERTWGSGLHQAVESKERVTLTPENETQARITRQRYSGFYQGMCGLTGTATGSENEMREFYKLPVVQIPTNKPCLRQMLPLRSFATADAKFAAIADDAVRRSQAGQPVLIGTRTIHESKQLAVLLDQSSVKHVVLNGLQDEDEAKIVANAGVAGRITVATNMAGRGTDIRLDKKSLSAGGLHVIATEFHHSQRVDRQLAGRSARQGNPGSCQFFASADDDLIANRDESLAKRIQKSASDNGECRDDFYAAIKKVQANLEREARISRRSMVDHDNWLESVQSSLARRA